MKKAWSLSTTVRNPDRILPFLQTLREMEGEVFDEAGQVKFQTLLIKNKLYRPTGLNAVLNSYYTNDGLMSLSQAQEVFEHMRQSSAELQKDPGLRGRTSVAPLTKMGLAIATKSDGPVRISSTGQAFINGSLDIGDIYFRFFLKWQLPTPGSNDFSNSALYDIKPFLGTLQLIGKVNALAHESGMVAKGLSKAEFSLFAQTLIQANDIDKYAQQVIALRKQTEGMSKKEAAQAFIDYSKAFTANFLDTTDTNKIDSFLSTLHDYGDNSIRYFRLTRYIYIRGGGYYVDLEPRRHVEINELLKLPAESDHFTSAQHYNQFLADISQPHLPWATTEKLLQIIREIAHDITLLEASVGKQKQVIPDNLEEIDTQELGRIIATAREYRRTLQESVNHQKAASPEAITGYIEKLQTIFNLEDKPIQLEKYTTLSLHALNDAVTIQPNYPVGDDNEPTFTAPANVPDIECFYASANLICEVTMLTSRDQWINEGQPVMRHLRDFETLHPEKPAYCLFIAPALHRDTINTYWPSIKYGYEGVKQKIIPLTIGNFTTILETVKALKENGKQLRYTQLFELYDAITDLTESVANSIEWQEAIPKTIEKWCLSVKA